MAPETAAGKVVRNMRKKIVAVGVAALLLLGGCDRVRETVGLTKRAPDEFTIITKAPLVLPPDFSLRPPQPGAQRPQETAPRTRARQAMIKAARGGGTGAAPAGGTGVSGGESAILKHAGATGADSSIRKTINRETTQLAEQDNSFTDRILFWQDKLPYGSTLDADKEAKRIRENAAAGRSVTEGETPVIKRRKRGWLEGIF
jgi:hypothetical protein